jgi:hypothetical protein
MQASRFDGISFDPFSLIKDSFIAPEVDVSGRDVVEALMVTLVVVMIDQGFNLGLKITWQEVVFQQDTVV